MQEEIFHIVDSPVALTNKQEETPVLYKFYKLRRKTDGLYSNGGAWPGFNAKGKTWNTLAALSGHLAQHTGDRYARTRRFSWTDKQEGIAWEDLEIVCLEVRENVVEKQEALEYVKGMKERREKRVAKQKERQAKEQVRRAKVELEQAKKKVEEIQSKYGF
jgi:hypothetical protein